MEAFTCRTLLRTSPNTDDPSGTWCMTWHNAVCRVADQTQSQRCSTTRWMMMATIRPHTVALSFTGREAVAQHRSEPRHGMQHCGPCCQWSSRVPPAASLDAGATRAAAAGNLYEAANSSHGNLMDLQQQQQETLQSQRQVCPQHHRAAVHLTAGRQRLDFTYQRTNCLGLRPPS